MAKLKIEVREDGQPSATFTIPLWLARNASGLLSKVAGKSLHETIDIDEILRAAESPGAHGVLLQIEDHEDDDSIIISIVGDDGPPAQTDPPRPVGDRRHHGDPRGGCRTAMIRL